MLQESDSTSGSRGIALFPYTRELLADEMQEGDLEFQQNDVITDIVKKSRDWWEGSLQDRRGVFPAAFVTTRCLSIMKVTHPYEAQREDEISAQKGKTVRVYEEKENGWARIICKGDGGLFPSNHLSEVKSRNVKVTKTMSCGAMSRSPVRSKKLAQSTNASDLPSSQNTEKMQAKVVKQYDAQHPGDLQLTVDAIIELTKTKGAWWEGIHEGNKGIFPAKCVQKI